MPAEKDLRAAADRIEGLLQELAALGDPHARAKAEELVRLLMRLYGEGLERVLGIVYEEGGGAVGRVFDRLGDDSLVSSLLVLHGLHPLDVETRVQRALDRVRPYLGSHGGDVKLLAVEEGVVRLRLEGSCHGCPSSAVTMKLAVERAIEEAAPEITGIAVEGAVGETAPGAAADGGMLQLGKNGHSWIAVGAPPPPGPGGLAALDLAGAKVVVCQVDETWYAYRDVCPSCGSLLAGGSLRHAVLVCPSCERRYDVRRAGGCLDGDGLHLEPLPLLAEQGALSIAVPARPA